MAKDTDPVRVICRSCGARYTVRVSWLDSAVEFGCSCGAHLKADMDDLFQFVTT
jgi:lysyl-tRNA synthetase class I